MFSRMVGRKSQVVPADCSGTGEANSSHEVRRSKASDVSEVIGGVAVVAGGAAAFAVGQVAAQASVVVQDSRDRASQMLQQLKDTLEVWMKRKLQVQIARVVDRLPGVVKDLLEDDDMPRLISRGKDRMVDNMWPDVRTEVLWEVAVLLDKAEKQPEEDAPGCDCVRAFFRYHMFPYDKSFWKSRRDPWYWLFLVIPLIPFYGIIPGWFAFVFVVIDKSDEYQLVNFILSFKGMAFLSQGLIRAIMGFVMFMGCVTARAKEAEHDCEDWGPGSTGNIWPMTLGLGFQVIIVWVAFVLLKCSVRKGKSAVKGDIEAVKEEGIASVRGGYIVYLLWYDLACFLLCTGIVSYVVYTRPTFDPLGDWPVHHAMFGAQVLFGILSVPFFLFTLPVLQRLLTHALPTAYDSKGTCRKFDLPPRRRPLKPAEDELVSEEEVQDLYSQLKGLLPGGGAH